MINPAWQLFKISDGATLFYAVDPATGKAKKELITHPWANAPRRRTPHYLERDDHSSQIRSDAGIVWAV
jgi:hypothetical protein